MDPVTPDNPTPAAPPDWFESLPPELQGEKSVQNFKGKPIAEVVKSYVSAQQMVGGSIRLPKPDAPPEEQERFYQDIYTKLGRPESPDKYDTKRPTLPDGTPWDDAGEKDFLANAHKAGLTKKQAQAVMDWWGSRLTSGMQAQQQQIEATVKTLKQEWGHEFDDKVAQADRAAEEIGGKEYVELLRAKGIASHPLVVRAHAAFGELLPQEVKAVVGNLPGRLEPNQATLQLNTIFANKDHPYFKGDQQAADEVAALIRQSLGQEGKKVVATIG